MSETEGVHVTDDDLVLHYYGEEPQAARVDAHLDVCDGCRERWEDLRHTLAAVTEESAAGISP